ncbi:MAG: hypothetical protein GF365_02675 [Candidatus Buchananbacteria bacterium]|nr:hypothetical protein [Candidatus Buchananbacteria bacterium]
MPKNEISKTPEQLNFELFKQKYLEALNDNDPENPDIYKVFLSQPDILLVLGKLKPATEFYMQEENIEEFKRRGYWKKDSIDDFLNLLNKKFNLQNFKKYTEGGDLSYLIYDVAQIKQQIKKFPELLPWDENKTLPNWIDSNLDAGVHLDYINGALYGFPKSAIDFYLEKDSLMDVDFQGIGTYGEDYGVPPGELAPDVLVREQAKKKFFEKFENDQKIQTELSKIDALKDEILQIRDEIISKKDAEDERLK